MEFGRPQRESGFPRPPFHEWRTAPLPDLENFQKICRWLKVDPSAVLGFDADSNGRRPIAAVHFRKKQTMELETASALAEMILAAQRALIARDEL